MTKFFPGAYQALGAAFDAKSSHSRGIRGAPEERGTFRKRSSSSVALNEPLDGCQRLWKGLYFPYSHISDITSWVMTSTKDHIFTCQIWHLLNELGIPTHVRSWSWLWSNRKNDIYWTINTTMQILVGFFFKDIFLNTRLKLRPYGIRIQGNRLDQLLVSASYYLFPSLEHCLCNSLLAFGLLPPPQISTL